MDYKIIADEADLLAEKQSWNRICGTMPDSTPFQTWEWNYHWWKHNEHSESLFVIKAFEGSRIFGYAPLVIKNKTAEFIGGRHMDYGRFVVAQRQLGVIEGFLELLLKHGFGLALQEMASRDTQLHMVQRLLEGKGRYLSQKTTRAAFVDLPHYGSMEEYLGLLSQSMRNKTVKAGLKKGLQIGREPVTDKLLEDIVRIYASRQDARGGATDISWAFPVICQLHEAQLLEVYVARDGAEAVGFLVAFRHNAGRYIWLVAFKMEYRDRFPGQLLFYQALSDGFAEGCSRVDFMRGDYDFKLRWECQLDTNYTVYVCRNYFDYWKKKLYFAVKPAAKKLVCGIPFLERIYRNRGK